MKYHVQYKCRMCGNLITHENEIEIANSVQGSQMIQDMIEELGHGDNYVVIDGVIYPIIRSHNCTNTCYGVCDLVGLAFLQRCRDCQYSDDSVYFDPRTHEQVFRCVKDGKLRPGYFKCDKNDVIIT